MKVVIDHARCTGHGRCYDLAPEVFADDDDGYGQVREESLAPEHEEAAKRAVATCPERAISLLD